MVDHNDIEPGWNGLAILLWPVALYFKIKQWFADRRQPKTTVRLHCDTYYECPHRTECIALQRCTGEDETMG